MATRLLLALLLLGISTSAFADCVYGAKDKSSFVVLDSHTLLLKGGYGGDIIVKTYCFINRTSEITVLKDDICSYESSTLYIDGQVCDANQVTKLR